MKEYAIFDLDNCISNDIDRINSIDWHLSNKDGRYDLYHAALAYDAAANLEAVMAQLNAGRSLVFLTGRPVKHHVTTCAWIENKLRQHCGYKLHRADYTLLMRPDDCYVPAVELKRSMLDTLDFYNIPRKQVRIAFDDRQDIVDMYIKEGLIAHVMRIHDLDAHAPPSKAAAEHAAEAFGLLPGEALISKAELDALTMEPPAQANAADILAEAAETFRQRNAVYGSNYEMVGPIMKILFPKGLTPELLGCPQYHLLELIVVKLSRFAISDMKHQDSIHDSCVYAALIESIVRSQQNG
jgi:hypothetical protein